MRACADALLASGKLFDVVIANAGVMATPFSHTADGFEAQFGTNHLGHFVLANRIVPLIRAGGRLINVSSSGHASPMSISRIPTSSGHLTTPLLLTAGRRRRISSSRLLSIGGIASGEYAPRPYIRERFRPNWPAI